MPRSHPPEFRSSGGDLTNAAAALVRGLLRSALVPAWRGDPDVA